MKFKNNIMCALRGRQTVETCQNAGQLWRCTCIWLFRIGCGTLKRVHVGCWLLGNYKAFYWKWLAAVEKPNILNIEDLASCATQHFKRSCEHALKWM